jgi:hypothetical protein
MATFDGTNRVMRLRKVRDPNDEDNFVLIPVIETIQFSDPKDSSQERVVRFNNSVDTEARVWHTRRVLNKSGTPSNFTEDEDNYVDVARIDSLTTIDPKSASQEVVLRLDNRDDDGSWPAPPGALVENDLTHVRNVVRYTADNTPDGVPWVDVELINIILVRDPKTEGQEYVYRIARAEPGEAIEDEDDPYLPTFALADESLEVIEDDDPASPVMLDPFQNIVNVKWGEPVEPPPPLLIRATVTGGCFMSPDGNAVEFRSGDTLTFMFGSPPGNPENHEATLDSGSVGFSPLAGYNHFLSNPQASGLQLSVDVIALNASPPFDSIIISSASFTFRNNYVNLDESSLFSGATFIVIGTSFTPFPPDSPPALSGTAGTITMFLKPNFDTPSIEWATS